MKYFRGIIDRFEGKRAVIVVDELTGFSEGDAVKISLQKDEVGKNKTQKRVKNLLKKILKGK